MGKIFNEKIYNSIAIDKLTIFAIFHLSAQHEECAFERLAKECFTLFPKRFCLRRYSQWPDSNRVYLSMIRCRNNGWVVGNEKSGFQITEFGIKIAKDISDQLDNVKIEMIKNHKTINKQSRERGETIINFIKQSKAFINFKSDKNIFTITEGEFREMLGATRETPERVLKQNFEYCLNVCKEYKERELIDFLTICRKQMFR
ncbi:hypothetical protein AUJ66_02250 [Candidatus Desantisbacteria bacterium CG1_02_38_46]|uniref:Uncharacterized protein n=2 Tax=unclassified Candidatus Desantisiibacteriota TaxID=3106372 RepID=A0A1J4SIB0_9BACT|nr:MAG: hypothetical protein AUJ66_02250 [Candidatus Desantisbacteria bacterium CG1_02_38_46]PIU51099.1 MAG: hypothetical protein COS91_06270 [Candidatus Desantisbacteria bacterium CG07_land_8_20_14_0_80_39_15]